MKRPYLPADALARHIWQCALTTAFCQPVVGVLLWTAAALALLLEVLS
ncbi:hypothetical protein [Deinococcus hopiensis]|uniref:Uncharacterized protein n=1 Tax=Deinococcus hopiensis KR-140 TaxID=695939 RepID=A0A1W1V6U9_9DEIO|nr:hypothetical protein [Deinococcus hopiensis]SMB89128.1 hypothetical protein SAMN00790413_00280 [Deinococcus hopiensis KR-140]